jgi:DNA replication protein DnaC
VDPRRRELLRRGPAGTGKSHSLVAFGVAAVQAGFKVRYFTAADLVETLYRGLADNSVGRTIENLLLQGVRAETMSLILIWDDAH